MGHGKKMKLNCVFSWDLYPYDVMFSVGQTSEEVIKILRKITKKITDADIQELRTIDDKDDKEGKTIFLSGGQTLIWLSDYKNKPEYMGLLAHEVFHATFFLMNHVGIRHADESEEAFTYAAQWLMVQLMDALTRRK
jgi:hypothetical protein